MTKNNMQKYLTIRSGYGKSKINALKNSMIKQAKPKQRPSILFKWDRGSFFM